MSSDSPARDTSTLSSTSTSNGCGRVCSSASTPCTPSSRSPLMMIESTSGRRAAGARESLVDRGGDDLAAGRAELAPGQLLDQHDGVRAVTDDAAVEEVAGE